MKIIIVDDHKLLSELLKKSFLGIDDELEITVFSKPNEALDYFKIFEADILITDLLMPQLSGFELIKQCRIIKEKLGILVLSSMVDPVSISEAINNGANGYLVKDTSLDEIFFAIKSIIANPQKTYLSESLKDINLNTGLNLNEFKLSPREKNIINLICEGNTIKEIAAIEHLSVLTVQSYMKQLMHKMRVNRTPDLILKALKTGMFVQKIM